MKQLQIAYITECLKLRRSGIFWITIILFIFIPLMMSFMLIVAKNPELGAKLGIIGTKAKFFGNNDWIGYLTILNQSIASMGFLGFGFVASYIFGREYSERTLKDILALPISRTSIVIAKFIVIILWCVLLALIFYIVSISMGFIIGLENWNTDIITKSSIKFFSITVLTLFLSPIIAFFACYGKGITAPLGITFVTMILAQFAGMLGFGPYFPGSIPGILSAPEGTPGMELTIASYFIISITGAVGFFGTLAWWKYADHQ